MRNERFRQLLEKDLKPWRMDAVGADTEMKELRAERDRMFHAIGRQANVVRNTHGMKRLHARADRGRIDLSSYEAVRAWFKKREHANRVAYAVARSDEVGQPLPVPTFDAFCVKHAVSGPELQHLKDIVCKSTWADLRGPLFEWLVFLALVQYAVPGQIPETLTLDGRCAGIPVMLAYAERPLYLWYQRSFHEPTLGTTVRPDFSLTIENEEPNAWNVDGTVECKSTSKFGNSLVHQVWGRKELITPRFAVLAVDHRPSTEALHHLKVGGIHVLPDVFGRAQLAGMDARQDTSLFDRVRDEISKACRDGAAGRTTREKYARYDGRERRRMADDWAYREPR
jgi:hypothetical protein